MSNVEELKEELLGQLESVANLRQNDCRSNQGN